MDENKIRSEAENATEETIEEVKEEQDQAETETVETTKEETSEEDTEKEKKPKRMRNQALLRRGSFSIAITAVVIAGIIVLNILAAALSKRVLLEYDMTPEKKNSISAENAEYLKKIDKKVTITVCAKEDEYVSQIYSGLYSDYGNYLVNPTEYLDQTITLLEKYPIYNRNITLEYLDTQTQEMMSLTKKYADEELHYGSIIVSSDEEEGLHKILNFKDIYEQSDDYYTFEITGNKLETALTGAIAYVAGGRTKKVALLTGHSSGETFDTFQDFLKENNYEVSVIEDQTLTSISTEYDIVAIVRPTLDFKKEEITAISQFLENGGKRDKSLLYFPAFGKDPLTQFNDFLLTDWGISVEDNSVLFETDENMHVQQAPYVMKASLTEEHSDMGGKLSDCWVHIGVPVSPAKEMSTGATIDIIAQTSDTVVAIPYEDMLKEDFDGSTDSYTQQSYCAVLRSEIMGYNEDNEEIKSQVFVFNSATAFLNLPVEEVYGYPMSFEDYYGVNSADQNVLKACGELAIGGKVANVFFETRNIQTAEFTRPTEGEAKAVRRVWMLLIPLLVLAAGVTIYIRRRNAR